MARWPVVAVLLLGSAIAAVLVFRQAPGPEAPRDRVVAAAIPDSERLSIVAFGTSLTQRAIWPERLGVALRDCGFREAAVTVRARPGAGSAEGLALIGSDAARPRHLALIEFAINDADLVDGVSRGTSLANHRAMIAALRARHPGIAVLLVTTNPVAGLQRLKRPKLMAYDDLYQRLAGEMGASLFDGAARWVATPGWQDALPDGLHPEPEVEAALYTRPLAGMVARIFGRTCPG